MSHFSLCRKLPSCTIDKSTVINVEMYLREHAPYLLDSDDVGPQDQPLEGRITIEDAFGSESIISGEELRDMFSDSTKQVTFFFHSGKRHALSVRLMFTKND